MSDFELFRERYQPNPDTDAEPMSPEMSLYVVKAAHLLGQTILDSAARSGADLFSFKLMTEDSTFLPGKRLTGEDRYILCFELQYGLGDELYLGSLDDFDSQFYPGSEGMSDFSMYYPLEPTDRASVQISFTKKDTNWPEAVRHNEAPVPQWRPAKSIEIPYEGTPRVEEVVDPHTKEQRDATNAEGMAVFADLSTLIDNLNAHLANGGEVKQ